MNKSAVQRQSRPLLPELSELFNGFPTFANLPALAGLRPFFDSHLLRLEDEMKEGLYEVRAELPGVDPTDGIEVTVADTGVGIPAGVRDGKRPTAMPGRPELLKSTNQSSEAVSIKPVSISFVGTKSPSP